MGLDTHPATPTSSASLPGCARGSAPAASHVEESLFNPMKYRSAAIIDAMRQSALGRFMAYLGTPEEIDEAFAFAPADASEPYYAALRELAVEAVRLLESEQPGALRSALDVGAGVGRVAYDLARTDLVAEVIALEQSPELVTEIARLAAGEQREVVVPVSGTRTLRAVLRPPGPAPRLRPILGDAHALPFADGEFSFVMAFGLLDRVRRPKAAVAELARVLAPHGVALVSCLHDFPGGPAEPEEWVGSASEVFVDGLWSRVEPRNEPLDLRHNGRYVEHFKAEIVWARRASV